jgi:arylsulfatase
VHAPFTGKGHFDQDQWELYHVDADRSESTDLAKKYPKKLQKLIDLWFEEAEKNMVLPMDDRSAVVVLGTPRPAEEEPRERYVYYPGASPVPEGVAVNTRGRSYKIIANVEITDAKASGVIFAHGSRFGGHALYMRDGKVVYAYNFLGIKPEQQFKSPVLKPGKYTLGMEFVREKAGGHGESLGKARLYVNEQVVDEGPMKTQPGKFTLSGDGLCIGYDSGDAVSEGYTTPGEFEGGTILAVGVTVEKKQYLDLEKLAQAALARD